MYMCRVFQKGLIVDEFYPEFNFECIIKTNIFVFFLLKSYHQNQSTRKTMAFKPKWRLKLE